MFFARPRGAYTQEDEEPRRRRLVALNFLKLYKVQPIPKCWILEFIIKSPPPPPLFFRFFSFLPHLSCNMRGSLALLPPELPDIFNLLYFNQGSRHIRLELLTNLRLANKSSLRLVFRFYIRIQFIGNDFYNEPLMARFLPGHL